MLKIIIIIVICLLVITGLRIFINFKKKVNKVKKNILNKKGPSSLEDAMVYEEAVRDCPSDEDCRAWGSHLLFQHYYKNYNSNEEILLKGVRYGEDIRSNYKDYPFYEDDIFELGNIYFFVLFDFNKAEDVYKQLVTDKPNTRWKSIAEDRSKLIKDNVSDKESLKLYVMAEKNFEEAKYDKAEYYLKEFVKKNPDTELSASALYFLGDINYYKYSDFSKSKEYYRITVDKFPETSSARHSLYKIGEILRKQEKWEAAIETYQEYIKRYKSSPFRDDAYYFIGESLQKLGKLKEAKNAFSLILGDYPDSKWTEVIYHKVQEINRELR